MAPTRCRLEAIAHRQALLAWVKDRRAVLADIVIGEKPVILLLDELSRSFGRPFKGLYLLGHQFSHSRHPMTPFWSKVFWKVRSYRTSWKVASAETRNRTDDRLSCSVREMLAAGER